MPGMMDDIGNFLFGKKALEKAAQTGGPPAEGSGVGSGSGSPAYSQSDMMKMGQEAAERAKAKKAPPAPPSKRGNKPKIDPWR